MSARAVVRNEPRAACVDVNRWRRDNCPRQPLTESVNRLVKDIVSGRRTFTMQCAVHGRNPACLAANLAKFADCFNRIA
jgi:hypothetical protein